MPKSHRNHSAKTDPATRNGRAMEAQASSETARGTTTLIAGCMFSGKTRELLRRLRCHPPDRRMAFKHVIDFRYRKDAVVTHDGDYLPAVPVADGREIGGRAPDRLEILAIDEAHFFEPDADGLVDTVQSLARRGIHVVLTGLDLDSWGRPFPVMERLAALVDEPIVMQATCARCGGLANRTQRTTPIIDGQIIGGPESFEPRCENCWSPPPEPPLAV
jgi:thymidine kinase